MDSFRSFHSASQGLLAHLKALRDRLDSSPESDEEVCPLCDGYGNIVGPQGARPCQCAYRRERNTLAESARIPAHYREKDLNNFEADTPALRACLTLAREYVQHYSPTSSQGLYIYGEPGCGKTHLAIGILKGLLARGFDGVFYNLTDLFDQLRTLISNESGGSQQEELICDLQRDILVLDDVGIQVQKQSAWVADRLYSFINYRYQNCKTLILTTDVKPRDFTLRMDLILSSRVFAMCREIEIRAEDYRAKMRRLGKTTWP